MTAVATLFLSGLTALLFYLYCTGSFSSIIAQRYGCQRFPERFARDPFFALDHKYTHLMVSKSFRALPEAMKMFQKYGSTYQTTALFNTTIRSADATNIQAVWGTRCSDWGIQPSRLAGMSGFCGEGFITADGHAWLRSKSFLAPFFRGPHRSVPKSFESAVDTFLDDIPGDNHTTDLQPMLSLLFFESAKKFLIGDTLIDDPREKECPVDSITFLTAFQKSMRGCGMRIMLGPLRFLVPKTMTVDQWCIVHQFIDFYVAKTIRLQRVNSSVGKDSPTALIKSSQPASMLEHLVSVTHDTVEIRNQMIQALMAASDTTAALTSNTLFLLARNSAIWARLQDEVALIDPSKVVAEELKSLRLLQDTLKESLRLYPVFGNLARTALSDTKLPTGGGVNRDQPVNVKVGTKYFAHFYALHRDEKVFGSDVESFRPDRWKNIYPTPWQYMPFGGGQRPCLGQQKAKFDASFLLIKMLQCFESIKSHDDRNWAGDTRLTTWNANGCKVGLVRR